MNALTLAALLSAAIVPLIAASGALIAGLQNRRQWCLRFARLECAAGAVSGAALAGLLSQARTPADRVIQCLVWQWYSFAGPQSPSVDFGLEADVLKAIAISVMGGLAFVGLWRADDQQKEPLSVDAMLTTSLLYASGIVFVLAPNPAQEFAGWATASVCAATLIHLSHAKSSPNNRFVQRVQSLSAIPFAVEQQIVVPVRYSITTWFPSWVVEQFQVLAQSSASLQWLAIALGASAIMLSWLW